MSLLVSTNYASPYLQENLAFCHERTVYFVDRQIIRLAKTLFRSLIQNSQVLLPTLVISTEHARVIDLVFQFFQFGRLSYVREKDKKQLFLLSQAYDLPLLHRYLHKKIDFRSSPDLNKLFLRDQLAIFALQQKPEHFCLILRKLKPEEQLQKEVLSFVAYFQPTMFERLMVDYIVPSLPDLYLPLLQMYCHKRWTVLENELHFFQHQELKFHCLAENPQIDRRLQWFEFFWKEMPHALIEKAIIQPLIHLGRFAEAKSWISKIQDHSYLKFIKKRKNFLPLASQKGEWKIDPAIPVSFYPVMQEIIFKHIYKQFNTDSDLGKLIDILEEQFQGADSVQWNETLFMAIFRTGIQAVVQKANEIVAYRLRAANIPFKPFEAYLHPALQSSCEFINQVWFFLEEIFKQEFKHPHICALGISQKLWTGIRLTNEIYSVVRQSYCRKFSLQEDFIVQFVSAQLQSYGVEHHFSIDQPPLLQQLESAFKQARLGNALSEAQIELAFSIYIQKRVEDANFRHFFSYFTKLNLYNSVEVTSDVQELIELAEQTFPMLLKDFPLEQIQKRAPQLTKYLIKSEGQQPRLSVAELKREIFVKSLHAYYYSLPSREVQYEQIERESDAGI